MNLKDINTKNWQLSLSSGSSIVTDADDINQCLWVILTTRKGSDPLRPNFGSSVFDYIDKPNAIAIPGIKKEILESIGDYEPRITITRIDVEEAFGDE